MVLQDEATHGSSGDSHAIAPLIDKVASINNELAKRRQQLYDDLRYFESKLKELDKLDPYDFTGLSTIYVRHADNIRKLLASIGDVD
ncbi:MAG: hypothetical protein O3C28_04230 [Proteobacteria bacterium]|nr:hypothetical protein [Pseudomonadota bacterium]